jgi:hypothetical protein
MRRNFGSIEGGDGCNYWFHKDYVLPAFRKDLSSHLVVSFTPGVGEKGRVARGVTVLSHVVLTKAGLISESDVAPALAEFAYATVADAPSDGVALDDLARLLRTEFRSAKPMEALLGKKLGTFIASVEGLTFFKNSGRVVLSKQPVFGRLPTANVRKADRGKKGKTPAASGARMPTPVVRNVKERHFKRNGDKKVHDAMRQADVDRVKVPEDIAALVKADITSQIETAQRSGTPMLLSTLGEYLASLYPGSTKACARLGFKDTAKLLKTMPVVVIGPAPRNELSVVKGKKEDRNT